MSDLRKALVKLANERPETRKYLIPLLQKHAMEHATEEARKKYLKEHPNADPKKHTVKKPSKPKRKKKDDFYHKLDSDLQSVARALGPLSQSPIEYDALAATGGKIRMEIPKPKGSLAAIRDAVERALAFSDTIGGIRVEKDGDGVVVTLGQNDGPPAKFEEPDYLKELRRRRPKKA